LLQDKGISALTLAIILGMLVGNTAYPLMAPVSESSPSSLRELEAN
jgi:uncharacterized membrane protein YadS